MLWVHSQTSGKHDKNTKRNSRKAQRSRSLPSLWLQRMQYAQLFPAHLDRPSSCRFSTFQHLPTQQNNTCMCVLFVTKHTLCNSIHTLGRTRVHTHLHTNTSRWVYVCVGYQQTRNRVTVLILPRIPTGLVGILKFREGPHCHSFRLKFLLMYLDLV